MKGTMRVIARLTVIAVLVSLLVGVLPWARPSPAYGATETRIIISVPAQVAPGSNFTATVNITNVQNFDGCQYDVSFNATVLRLDNVTNGVISGTTIPVEFWTQSSPGMVRILQNVPGFSGVSGSGYLAALNFGVIGSANQSSNITLPGPNGVLGDNQAQAIPAIWTGVTVQISTQPSSQVAQPPTASFTVSSLSIAPTSITTAEVLDYGGHITISVVVTNTGSGAGSYTVILKINGASGGTVGITLGAGESSTVVFSVAPNNPRVYNVDVHGNLGQFTVTATPDTTTGSGTTGGSGGTPPTTPPPTVTSEPAPTSNVTETNNTTGVTDEKPAGEKPAAEQPATPAPSPESQTTTSSETISSAQPSTTQAPPAETQSESIDWRVLGGVIGGVVIVFGLIIFFQVKRRA